MRTTLGETLLMDLPRTSSVLSCLCLLAVGVPASLAQPVPPPAPRMRPWASLTLHVNARGDVRATLRLPFQPQDPETWQELFADTLDAPLDHVGTEKSGRWWTLSGQASGALRREGWTVDGVIDWEALMTFLGLHGIGTLIVSVEHPHADFSECSLEDSTVGPDILNTRYSATVPTSSASPLHLRFGLAPERFWRLLPLVIVLLVPVAWTLWRVRRPAYPDDRFREWFAFARFHRRLLVTTGCVWLVAVAALGVLPVADFFVCGLFARGEWVWLAPTLLLPPALTMLVCRALSAPDYARVPEVGWTRGQLLRQGMWAELGGVVAFTCLGWGIDAQIAEPASYWGVLTLAAAGGLMLVCMGGWIQARNIVLNVLPPGELRSRLFELADQVRVRVRQAYQLPPAHWRLVNAVGAAGECVAVTADVLPPLSRREVDALLALELARVWRGHRWALGRLLLVLVPILGLGCLSGVLGVFGLMGSIWPLFPLFFGAAMGLRMRRRTPHFAAALDRDALAITGDPEALITALAKLRRLDLLPVIAGGRDEATGSSAEWPRLQDLADRAGIPPDRLHEILDSPGSGAGHYPPLPAAPGAGSDADPRVFSRQFKRRAFALQSWTGLTLEVATPALVASLALRQQWRGAWLAGAYLMGLPLTALLRRLGVRFAVIQTSLALRRGIRDRLAAEGLAPESHDGVFVGLSPDAEPRNYESFVIWDMGFLVLDGDRLCYLGDRTRFALSREDIRAVSLGPGSPGRAAPPRVYIAWQDDRRGVGGTFNLTLSEAALLGRPRLRPADLLRRLRDWQKQTTTPATPSRLPTELPGPDFGAVASESLGRLAAGNILVTLLIFRAPFAIGACLLLGLPFDRAHGGGGWYVLGSVALLQAWTVLSFLPYRRGRTDSEDADAPPPEAIDPAADAR